MTEITECSFIGALVKYHIKQVPFLYDTGLLQVGKW